MSNSLNKAMAGLVRDNTDLQTYNRLLQTHRLPFLGVARVIYGDQVLATGTGLVIPSDLEIESGYVFELQSDSVLEIC